MRHETDETHETNRVSMLQILTMKKFKIIERVIDLSLFLSSFKCWHASCIHISVINIHFKTKAR